MTSRRDTLNRHKQVKSPGGAGGNIMISRAVL